MINYRYYQKRDIENILSMLKQHKKILYPLPTRLGKTEVAIGVALEIINRGGKVAFLAHLDQLVTNIASRFEKYGIQTFRVQGNMPSAGYDYYVCAKPTLARRVKANQCDWFFDAIDLFIVDEAHISPEQTEQIIKKSHNTTVLNLTATPYTTDGRGLDKIANIIVPTLDAHDAVEEGWKVRTVYYGGLAEIKGVGKQGGDYKVGELKAAFGTQKAHENPVEIWRKVAEGLTTVVYCVNIEHAHETADKFRAAGYPCAVINSDKEGYTSTNEFGNEEETNSILARFRNGEFKLIANVGMLTIGYDLPEIACVYINTVTLSKGKFLQMHRGGGLLCDVSDLPEKHQAPERLARIASSKKPIQIVILASDEMLANFGSADNPDVFSLKGLVKQEKTDPKMCPSCTAVMSANVSVCRVCSYVFPKTPSKKEKMLETALMQEIEMLGGGQTSTPEFLWKSFEVLYSRPKGKGLVEIDKMINAQDDYLRKIISIINENRKGTTKAPIKANWEWHLKVRRAIFKEFIELIETKDFQKFNIFWNQRSPQQREQYKDERDFVLKLVKQNKPEPQATVGEKSKFEGSSLSSIANDVGKFFGSF